MPEERLEEEPLRAEDPERDDGAEDPERDDWADALGALVAPRPAGAASDERAVLGGAETGIDRAGLRTPAEGATGTRSPPARGDAALSPVVRLVCAITTCSRTLDRLRSLSRLERSGGGGLAGSLGFAGDDSRAGAFAGALCTWLRGCADSPLAPDRGTDARGCR